MTDSHGQLFRVKPRGLLLCSLHEWEGVFGRSLCLGLGKPLFSTCWWRLGLAGGSAWTSLGLLPPDLGRKWERKGLGSGFHFAQPCLHWCGEDMQEGVRFALLLLLCFRPCSGGVLGVPMAFLHAWSLVFSCVVWCLPRFLFASDKSLDWQDWLLGEFPEATPRSALLEHPFGTKYVGRAVPTLTPFLFPDRDGVETCRENTSSFQCFSSNL